MTLDTAADHAGGRYDYTEKIHAESAAIVACVEVRGGSQVIDVTRARARTSSTFLYGNTSTYLYTIEQKGFFACSKRWPPQGPAMEKPETKE